MNLQLSLPAARRPIVAASLMVLVGVLVVLLAFGFAQRALTDSSVQGRELDAAGSQRRLAERIALDTTRLTVEPADDVIRDELTRTAELLLQVHDGLLRGDESIGLDGVLPDDVAELYGPEGLDLDERIDVYAHAAIEMATTSGPPSADLLAIIQREAAAERMVLDLDEVVAALAHDADRRVSTAQRRLTLSLLLISLGGVVTLALLALVGRRSTRLVSQSLDLNDRLSRSEDIHRATVEALPDGLAVINDRYEFLEVNSAGRRLIRLFSGTPFDPDDRTASMLPFVDADGRPIANDERPSAVAIRRGETVRNQILGIPTERGTYWIRCTATPVHHPIHNQQCAVLTFADITDELRITERLAAEEARFRVAVEYAPIAIALVAADGTLIDVNDSMCELVERSRSDLLELTIHDLSHPDDVEEGRSRIARLIDGEAESYQIEKRLVTSSGDTVDTFLAVAAVRGQSSEPYLIIEMIDISERKRAEQAQQAALDRQLELVAQLKELDVAKSQFVATVSHELRTPLAATLGYLELVLNSPTEPVTKGQREMLDIARQQGVQLLSLIEDLLLVARLESRQLSPEVSAIDPADLVRAVAATVRPLAQEKSVQVEVSVEPGTTEVVGDAIQLERALLNLAANAVKFTPASGRVDLVASPHADGGVQFRVQDTGVGIPADEQERVFERFYRTKDAHASATPGSGLGLAITSEIVHLHGGSIGIESTERVGTTVTITLPHDPPTSDSDPPVPIGDVPLHHPG